MDLLVSIFGALAPHILRVAQNAHAQVVHKQIHLLEMTTFVSQVILVHLHRGGYTQGHFGMDRGVEVGRHPAVMLYWYTMVPQEAQCCYHRLH